MTHIMPPAWIAFFVWITSVVVAFVSFFLFQYPSNSFDASLVAILFVGAVLVGSVSFVWLFVLLLSSKKKYIFYGSFVLMPFLFWSVASAFFWISDNSANLSEDEQSSSTTETMYHEPYSESDPENMAIQPVDEPSKVQVSAPIPRPVQVPTADEEKKLSDLEYRLETTREEMKDNRERLDKQLKDQQAEFDKQEATRKAALEAKRLLAEQKRTNEIRRIEAARTKCISDRARCFADIPSKIIRFSGSSRDAAARALKSSCEITYHCSSL